MLLCLLWPIAALAAGGLLWGVTFSKIATEHAALDKEALEHASGFSRVYAQQLQYLIEHADQTTRLVKYHWEHSRGSMSAETLLKQGIFPTSQLLHVIIADRNGNEILRSAPGPFHNVADSDYFIEHKAGKSDDMLVGTPETKRGTGTSVLHFTRRLNTPDGRFNGVVLLAVDPTFFSAFFCNADLGKGGLLAMMGLDGTLHMARMADDTHSPARPLLTRLPVLGVQEGRAFLTGKPWFADGRPRFAAWTPLASFPYVAMVGLSEDESHDAYKTIWAAYRSNALTASVLLFFFALVATFLSARLAFRRRQVVRIREDYGIATEGGNEAFYLLRALYGKGDATIDFEIIDCNERAAAFYGVNKAHLVGRKLSSICSDSIFAEVMETFRAAMQTGFHEDEYQVRPQSRLQMKWLRRKMVRINNRLVLTMMDISDAKAHEENMRRLAARLTTTLESITDAFYTLDRQWRFTYINKAAEIFIRRTRADLLGNVIWDEFRETLGTGRIIYREFHRALQENCTVEFEEFFPELEMWLDVRAYPSEEGLAVYFSNISDRKRAEQAILSSQAELRMLYDRLQTVREEERVALAREVHDQLGQLLSAAKIDIKLLEDDIRPVSAPLSRRKISKELRSAKRSIDHAIDSVRKIATELRPSELEDQGLFAALKWYVRDFERRTRIKCIVVIPDQEREPEGLVAFTLFRIFQEAMTNVMRHAKASEICLSLERRGSMILLRVRDNGIGISPAVARSNHSMGLKGMRERIAMVKGRLTVWRLQPHGTLVSARIPVMTGEHDFLPRQDSENSNTGDKI